MPRQSQLTLTRRLRIALNSFNEPAMRLLSLLFASLTLTGAAFAAPSSADTAFFLEASDCTAALKAHVEKHLKTPVSEPRNQAIQRDTELGFVYIGVAYKRGLRNPEADHMLKAAEERWLQLPVAQQTTRLNSCTQQAQHLMADVSGLERFLVRNRAKARVDKLLSREKRPTSP